MFHREESRLSGHLFQPSGESFQQPSPTTAFASFLVVVMILAPGSGNKSRQPRIHSAANSSGLGAGRPRICLPMVLNCPVYRLSSALNSPFTPGKQPGFHNGWRACCFSCKATSTPAKQKSREEKAVIPASRFQTLDQPRKAPAQDRSVCLFCARVVRFRSLFVQLSCLPCAKSLPARGEASVPPGNDLKEKIQATFNVYDHDTCTHSPAFFRHSKRFFDSTLRHKTGKGVRNIL